MIWNEKCSQVSCKTGALIKANTSAERYKFLQIAQQHQKWKKHGSTCLQCNQIYCRGQTKAEDLMLSLAQFFQGFKLQCNFFLLYQHHEDKSSIMSCKSSVCQEWPSSSISKLRRRGSCIISPESGLLQVSAPAPAQVTDTAGLLLSGGGGLLSIPRCSPRVCLVTLGNSAVPVN